uniref:Uncharacterized protein n=1 Tax=Cannabis sativa TaxID=3483 RepID=A0A803QYI6_CANSA
MLDCYWMLGVPFCSWQSQSKRLMPQLVPNMIAGNQLCQACKFASYCRTMLVSKSNKLKLC